MTTARKVKEFWDKSPNGIQKLKDQKFAGSFIRTAVFLMVLLYLAYQLSIIGWPEIFAALPTSPWFYLLSMAFVATPIIAEMINFQRVSGLNVSKHWKLFARKQVINEGVMSYAGEAYLAHRLTHLGLFDLRRVAVMLKDLALVRTFTANFWLIFIVLVVIFMGNSNVIQTIAKTSPSLVISVSALSLSVCIGALVLFRKLTRLKFSLAAKVGLVYLLRSSLVASILMTQWSIAIPGKALSEWFVFLMIFSISKKSPVGGDLVFASVIVTLPSLGGNTPEIAAMMISIAAVTQFIYFLGFLFTSDFRFLKRPNASHQDFIISQKPERLDALTH